MEDTSYHIWFTLNFIFKTFYLLLSLKSLLKNLFFIKFCYAFLNTMFWVLMYIYI
jgi:hypothetical protein